MRTVTKHWSSVVDSEVGDDTASPGRARVDEKRLVLRRTRRRADHILVVVVSIVPSKSLFIIAIEQRDVRVMEWSIITNIVRDMVGGYRRFSSGESEQGLTLLYGDKGFG